VPDGDDAGFHHSLQATTSSTARQARIRSPLPLPGLSSAVP
jgi:hypothetical protein